MIAGIIIIIVISFLSIIVLSIYTFKTTIHLHRVCVNPESAMVSAMIGKIVSAIEKNGYKGKKGGKNK